MDHLPPCLPLHTYRTVVYGLLCLQPILHLSYSQQIKEIRLKSLRASGCSASALPTRDYTELTLLYGTELDMNFILCWRDQRQRWQQLWILLILHLLAWRSLQLQILNLRSSCFSILNFRLKWLPPLFSWTFVQVASCRGLWTGLGGDISNGGLQLITARHILRQFLSPSWGRSHYSCGAVPCSAIRTRLRVGHTY